MLDQINHHSRYLCQCERIWPALSNTEEERQVTVMEKRNPYITTIGFDKTDPRHVQVAELLNSITRKKAQYIVEAVLAYQNKQGIMKEEIRSIDQEQIRTVVLQILEEQKILEKNNRESTKNDVGFDALAPYSGDEYDLLTGEQIAQGSRQLVEKKTQGVYRAKSGAFDRLMIAGERLIAVIKKCQGMANKDLGKFADQINSLCDKWDR